LQGRAASHRQTSTHRDTLDLDTQGRNKDPETLDEIYTCTCNRVVVAWHMSNISIELQNAQPGCN
jgi:hypothetical protein